MCNFVNKPTRAQIIPAIAQTVTRSNRQAQNGKLKTVIVYITISPVKRRLTISSSTKRIMYWPFCANKTNYKIWFGLFGSVYRVQFGCDNGRLWNTVFRQLLITRRVNKLIKYDDYICDLFFINAQIIKNTKSADGDVRRSVHEVYGENLTNDSTVSVDTSFP